MGEVKQTFIIGLGAVLVVTESISLGTLLAFYIATYAIDQYALALLKAYTQFLGSKEMVRCPPDPWPPGERDKRGVDRWTGPRIGSCLVALNGKGDHGEGVR